MSPWLSSCVTWSRAAPSWAPQLFLRSSLWLSARSIVTSHLDISLHDPQGQRPYFIYSCVSHNPRHIIRIQMFAWMNESMSKWTNLPPPTNRRLCLVHRHSVWGTFVWPASGPRGSACRHEPVVPAMKSDDKQLMSSKHHLTLRLFRETPQWSHAPLREARSYVPLYILFIPGPLSWVALGTFTGIFLS